MKTHTQNAVFVTSHRRDSVNCEQSDISPVRHIGGRDSSVGTATRYGMDGPGSNLGGG